MNYCNVSLTESKKSQLLLTKLLSFLSNNFFLNKHIKISQLTIF